MLIEIESVYGDKIIHGKSIKKNDLQNAMNKILKLHSEQDFLSIFCACYGYEELQCSDTVYVDYVIDLDTHLLIEPKYKNTKYNFNNAPKEHLAKELGDIAWYLAEAATALEIPLEDILQANIEKLKKRYPEGFETKRSLVRLQGDL